MTKINKDSWEIKKLGEVCDFQGGSQPPKDEWIKEPQEGYVRMLQIRDFTQSATDYIEYVRITNSTKHCKSDDILIGRYGASVGKILTGLEGAYNVAIIKSIPDENQVLKSYIRNYFEASYFQSGLQHVSKMRAAQQGFSKEDIIDFDFPLPPLPIQQRIVEELDEINAIISAKKQQLKELDELAQSIFYNMFGDPVNNEKGWEVKKYGEVFEIGSGGTPSKTKQEYWEEGTIPWIGSNMCQNCFVYDTDGKFITEEGLNHSSAKLLEPNTVLVALVGATIGKTALLKTTTSTNQNVAFIKTANNESFTPEFVFFNLTSLYEEFMNIGNGDFKMANLSFVRNLPIPLPPLPLQETFAARVSAIEEEKAAITASIDEMQTLLDARMQEYFG